MPIKNKKYVASRDGTYVNRFPALDAETQTAINAYNASHIKEQQEAVQRNTEYARRARMSGAINNIYPEFDILALGRGVTASLVKKVVPKVNQSYWPTPDDLATAFMSENKGKSKYIKSIAEDMYGLRPGLNFVDYNAANKYGSVFNERIKRTLSLAKQRGTLRTNIEPNIIVADGEGRKFLYDTFINDTHILPNRKSVIHVGDPLTEKGKLAKEYYYKTTPARDIFDSNPASFADRKRNTIIVVPKNGNYENMYKYTLPHEKTHIFIDGKKELKLFGEDTGLKVHSHKPGNIDINLDLYLSRPDEQLARGTQIKNYLGITDDSPITAKQLKYAAENYVKDTGYDNNMTDFFNMIVDYDKAAKWLSRAPVYTIPLGVGATASTIKNSYKNGGVMYNNRPKLFWGAAISGAGSGLSGAVTGASIGSIVPGIGTGVGAAVGGAIGLISGIFGHKSKEKQLAKEAAQQDFQNRIQTAAQLNAAAANTAYADAYRDRFTFKLGGNVSPQRYKDRFCLGGRKR